MNSVTKAATEEDVYNPPEVPDFKDNKIYLDKLGEELKVTFEYDDIAEGHTVGMRWRGNATYDLPLQKVKDEKVMTFVIPYGVVKTDLGNKWTSKLTASVGIPGKPLSISKTLEVRVFESEDKKS
ncbi:hypothetical protein [uncultured Pseudomonas sp.]|uniref:hypothetical protein n=1 Tax=uncultured Pseudomonas sp. TaxID=114707 RepID=UPI00258F21A8|nr:hypothetical protein [uncultured Pseudomonas sp.]